VLRLIAPLDPGFFLTGGPALSRAYYPHRYSDDLDFFINKSDRFDEQADLILATLREGGFSWPEHEHFLRNKTFITIEVHSPEYNAKLKIDFVNDSVPMFGEVQNTAFFPRVDSKRNILSNKLSAIFRSEGKDVADIRELALHEKFNWPQMINEGREKDGGLELALLSRMLETVPEWAYKKVIWHDPVPTWEQFKADIDIIAHDMINCVDNSLAR
jgi:hypothetical protein